MNTESISGLRVWEVVTRRPTKKINEDRQVSEFHVAADMKTVLSVIEGELESGEVIAIVQRDPLLTITRRVTEVSP